MINPKNSYFQLAIGLINIIASKYFIFIKKKIPKPKEKKCGKIGIERI
jgi:hypothetical protein